MRVTIDEVAETTAELARALHALGVRYTAFVDATREDMEGRAGLASLIGRLAREIETKADWTRHDWYLTCDAVAMQLTQIPQRWRAFSVTQAMLVGP